MIKDLYNRIEPLFPFRLNRKKVESDLEKIIRLDGYTEDDIEHICQLIRKDNFWKTNFLSPLKLRRTNKDGVKYIDYFAYYLKNKNKQNGKQTNEQIAKELAQRIANRYPTNVNN